MPKPEVKEEPKKDLTDPIIDLQEKEEIKEQDGIEIDLDPKTETKKEEPQYVTAAQLEKLQKQFNGISQTLRHVKDIPSQIAELKQSISSNRTLTNVEKKEAKDELDEMLEKGDWRTPVNRLAEKRFNELMEERDRQYQAQQAQHQKLTTLEANKKSVRDKYPDIDDHDSEIARRYQKVISEKPQYLQNEFGPTLAMRDMEDELRSEGRLDEFTRQVVQKEVARQVRVGAGAVPRNVVNSSSNKIMLTKEQKAFCDAHDLKYEDYGKYARKNSNKEGVEV
jgi:hypothetical protein